MDQRGLRGSSTALIDPKGRLKVPAMFRAVIQDLHGADVFVTSLTGESVWIYPMPVWLGVERKLSNVASTNPARLKYLDRVNYYGQEGELDSQGRVLIPQNLRESASIIGEVRVFGRIDHIEVWNAERFDQKLQRESWTREDALMLSEHGF